MHNANLFNDDYWSNRYEHQQTGWDIGEASTPLKHYIDQLEDKSIEILIPGCGNAYEADYLADNGFTNITLVDISHTLVEKLRGHFQGKNVKVLHQDFFDHQGQYDLILEQTFFCALDPKMRNDYVKKMVELLKPSGRLAGVLFNREFEGGPPFGGTIKEYANLFAPDFKIQNLEACYNSIAPRLGNEVWINVRKMA